VTLDSTGWIFSDLGPYRDGEGTYSLYPAKSLPPLPTHLFGKDYQWLPVVDQQEPQGDDDDDDETSLMEPIDVESWYVDLDVPESFRAFMSRPDLLASVPSNTACWWTLSDAPIASPLGDGAKMVNFLNDQQCCVYWYLYVWPDGRHAVVAGGLDYDDETVEPETARHDLVLVAPDFEQFLYRFWVENVAWFEAVQQDREWDDLSPPVRDYLSHYR
jgi:hypothetical protein